MDHARHGHHGRRRRIRKLVGSVAVGVVAVALLVLLIWFVRESPGGGAMEPDTGAGRIGDVWIGDACYEKRRDLKNVLFIATSGEDGSGIHPLAVYPQAAYVAILTIDESKGVYYLTTLDSSLPAEVSPINEFGDVSDGTAPVGAGATLGLAQAFGDGKRRSCMNTVHSVERMLDVIITNQVCLTTDITEKPVFLTDPFEQMEDLRRNAYALMSETPRMSFEAALAASCVYTDFRNEDSYDRLLDQISQYSFGGLRELGARATDADVNALRTELFLTALPGAATRPGAETGKAGS